jgi:hypothetical protein
MSTLHLRCLPARSRLTTSLYFRCAPYYLIQQYAGVLAYYGRNGCPIIQPLVYAKMLVSGNAIGNRPPGPLEAFGLTGAIYQDEFVRDVAAKLTKSALFFILATLYRVSA